MQSNLALKNKKIVQCRAEIFHSTSLGVHYYNIQYELHKSVCRLHILRLFTGRYQGKCQRFHWKKNKISISVLMINLTLIFFEFLLICEKRHSVAATTCLIYIMYSRLQKHFGAILPLLHTMSNMALKLSNTNLYQGKLLTMWEWASLDDIIQEGRQEVYATIKLSLHFHNHFETVKAETNMWWLYFENRVIYPHSQIFTVALWLLQ